MCVCTMDNPFTIVDWETFKKRSLYLLRTMPEVFLCGFLWQGFSLMTNANTYSTTFYFLTGLGSGLGAFVGSLLSNIKIVEGTPSLRKLDMFHSCAFFLAILFGSGTTWQRIVNDTKDYNMNFSASFFYMWLMSTLLFCTVLTVMRRLHTAWIEHVRKQDPWDDVQSVSTRFYYDVQLSLCVGLADAFFVGTVKGVYDDNWLGGAFGTTSSTPVFESMSKAGASTCVGFTLLCFIMNGVVKYHWLDSVLECSGEGEGEGVGKGVGEAPVETESPGVPGVPAVPWADGKVPAVQVVQAVDSPLQDIM
jgi:hypothetical protein